MQLYLSGLGLWDLFLEGPQYFMGLGFKRLIVLSCKFSEVAV